MDGTDPERWPEEVVGAETGLRDNGLLFHAVPSPLINAMRSRSAAKERMWMRMRTMGEEPASSGNSTALHARTHARSRADLE